MGSLVLFIHVLHVSKHDFKQFMHMVLYMSIVPYLHVCVIDYHRMRGYCSIIMVTVYQNPLRMERYGSSIRYDPPPPPLSLYVDYIYSLSTYRAIHSIYRCQCMIFRPGWVAPQSMSMIVHKQVHTHTHTHTHMYPHTHTHTNSTHTCTRSNP